MSFEPGTLAVAKTDSKNEKLGECATTYVEQRSCPESCVFFDGGGCYAEDGPLGKFVTQPLNRAAAMFASASPEEIAQAEANAIDRMQVYPGRPLRLHTVGDCKTAEAAAIVASAAIRYVNRGGGPVFTYTHAWRDVPRTAWIGVNVLASCETEEQVREANALGYAAAIVVDEFADDKAYPIAGGHGAVREVQTVTSVAHETPVLRAGPEPSDPGLRILPCPAQTRGRSCSTCRLCMNAGRLLDEGLVIGFAIHGTRFLRRKARLALTDPENPNRKRTLRDLIPEFEAEFVAREGRLPKDAEVAGALGYHPSSVFEMRKSLRTGQPTVKKPHRRKKTHV